MSLTSNLDAEREMKLLLEKMDAIQGMAPEQQLAELRRWAEDRRAAAKSGWL